MDLETFRTHESVDDWRMLGSGLHARYRCASLEQAAAFASEVSAETAALGCSPDLDLRAHSVTVRIPEHPELAIDEPDLRTAQAIQVAARRRGLVPDPDGLRYIQLAVAQAEGAGVEPFWCAVLGYEPLGDEDARDPHDRGPRLWFHELAGGAAGRGRTHVDVYVPADRTTAIVEAAVAAGGRVVDDSHAPAWWTVASPDNHGVDIAGWPDRTDR